MTINIVQSWQNCTGSVKKVPSKQISEMSSIMEVISSEKKMNPLSSPLKIETLKCIPNIVPGNWISSSESVWGILGWSSQWFMAGNSAKNHLHII